jgi:hypothetical protein
VTTAGREECLLATQASLRASDLDPVVLRDLALGLFANHEACWAKLFERAEWAMLFQDDLVASKQLPEAIALYRERFPEADVLTLYSGRRVCGRGRSVHDGYFWVDPVDFMGEVALGCRRSVWEGLREYIESGRFARETPFGEKGLPHHDHAWQMYAKSAGLKVLGSSPSLVQHTGRESTIGHPWEKAPGQPRIAATFRGEDFLSADYLRNLWGGEWTRAMATSAQPVADTKNSPTTPPAALSTDASASAAVTRTGRSTRTKWRSR